MTDPTVAHPNLLGLYNPDTLGNGRRLPVVPTMTCYTSAFHHPAHSGTTINERLLLQPGGGAAALWGPTGLGVTHGHDLLHRGFYQALCAAAPFSQTLGSLVDAGYLELFGACTCCQDSLHTYAILGDPTMMPKVFAPR